MGIPWPPPDYLKGVDCIHCYPPGETPLLMKATISGVTDCDYMPECNAGAINGTWILGQTLLPCRWYLRQGLFEFFYKASYDGGQCRFFVLWDNSIHCFSEWFGDSCHTSFTNMLTCVFQVNEGINGTCVITPAPFPHAADAIAAAASLGLTDEEIYKWEWYPIEGSDDIVIRFVRPSRRDCIYIRWTPT